MLVNAAAYTAVDQAEREPDVAHAINAAAVGVLAEEARRAGALLVHYSTDYVFDGTKDAPYVEEDPPNPLNAYGRSKLAGEQAIRNIDGAYLILRTSWVYAPHGKNFFLTVKRLLREKKELRVVCDQFGAPTLAGALARATADLLERHGVAALGEGPCPRVPRRRPHQLPIPELPPRRRRRALDRLTASHPIPDRHRQVPGHLLRELVVPAPEPPPRRRHRSLSPTGGLAMLAIASVNFAHHDCSAASCFFPAGVRR